MEIQKFIFNPFQENTYLLFDETKEAIIIDAGCYNKNEAQELINFVKKNELKLQYILCTHLHIDHIVGNNFLKEEFNLDIYAHKSDDFLIENAVQHGASYGLKLTQPPKVDKYIDETTILKFGNTVLNTLYVPGHSPGSIAFHNKKEKSIFVGDVLFKDSIGRTDLPMGDYDVLMKSIKEKLLVLDYDTEVYSGHGPSTSIGEEINTNSFLQEI